MIKRLLLWLSYYDWFLIACGSALTIFSLVILYSLQVNVDQASFNPASRQWIFAVLGIIGFFVLSAVNFRFWADYYKIILIVSAVLLIAVLFIGLKVNGATSWFLIFGQRFQPVEIVKLGLIIFLAQFYALHGHHRHHLIKDLIFAGFFSALLVGLVMLQPDFGSAILLFFIWLGMSLFLPLKGKTIAIIFAILLVCGGLFWQFFLQDYQKDRLLTFVDPGRDPLGSGYNIRQSMVAIGSGHLLGRGLGAGSQSQLNFLPEQQTEFIFAVIAEELGFVGAGVVLLLLFGMLWRLYVIGKKTQDNFGHFFILGSMAVMSAQIFVNIGMNMGIAPVTGVPLPFMSYGGSSLLSTWLLLGIANNIYIRSKTALFSGVQENE